jgi:hypothetical protein
MKKKILKAKPIISPEQFDAIRQRAFHDPLKQKELTTMNAIEKKQILESDESIGRTRFAKFLADSNFTFDNAMTALRAAPRDKYQVDVARGAADAKRLLGI